MVMDSVEEGNDIGEVGLQPYIVGFRGKQPGCHLSRSNTESPRRNTGVNCGINGQRNERGLSKFESDWMP